MSGVEIGLSISVSVLACIVLLFRFETRRGLRIAESSRARADFFIIKTSYHIQNTIHKITRDLIRQSIHFGFHNLLRYILAFVRKSEQWLKNVMRVNKKLAKNIERESITRTKLSEVALHKAATALTDEEKRAHREKMLLGD